MATATVARPAQALRQRDRAPRPSLAKRSTYMDGNDAPAKKRKMNEPYVRDTDYILRKHRNKQPSLVIHLHNTYFRFDGQEGSWAYDSPMRFVLEHLRKQTVPHQLLEELLSQNVPFYDGCLIVEVHNHKTKEGKEHGRRDSGADADTKFSMHNYNEHVTPSPAVPYPAKASTADQAEKGEGGGGGGSGEMAAPERPSKGKEVDGPKIFTLVLHPTALTLHHEMLLLAKTPASEMRGKKRSADNATPASAQPGTPSVPPTPVMTTRGPLSQSQRMCLEEGDFYQFQAEVLLATQPPLYLEPVSNPQDAERVLEMLADSLHNASPPSPKTRKRTTAEMAADDAQAAEAERRMLIMDERIKPSARAGASAAANENQGAAASLGFSRFKTLEMVRQKHEEQERIRKDEEARAAVEKKHVEEQNAAKTAQIVQRNRQHEIVQEQQRMNLRNRNEMVERQVRLREEHQQRVQMARDHAHPQQTPVMQNSQQANFQHPASMAQGSPVVRNQTPMMSSPMMPNGGFPMAPTSSQGAGSPPQRPPSAVQHRNMAMARQVSQQQHNSQNTTPQLQQGTPSMAQVLPNGQQQRSQTPRMPPGSPALPVMQGTPTSASMPGMHPTPQMGQQHQFTPEQMGMLRVAQEGGAHAGSPSSGGGGAGRAQMTPEQIQLIRAQQQQVAQNRARMAMAAQAAGQGQGGQGAQNNPQQQAAMQQYRMAQMAQQERMRQMQMQQQMGGAGGQAGSPAAQTPQMGHAHPQTPHPQQQQMQPNGMQPNGGGNGGVGGDGGMATQQQIAIAHAKSQQIAAARQAQAQFQQIASQYGGWPNIPAGVAQALPPNMQQLLKQQYAAQRGVRQQQAQRAQQQQMGQQAGGGGGGVGNGVGGGGGGEQQVVGGQPNPQYMQALRTNQAMLAQMQLQMQNSQQGQGGGGQQQQGGMGGMGQPQQQGFGGNNQGSDLNQHFANMHNALNRPGGPQGM